MTATAFGAGYDRGTAHSPCVDAAPGRLARLSLAGLQHAQQIGGYEVEAIAHRLYAWNRLPAAAWRRFAWLVDAVPGEARRAAGQDWLMVAARQAAGSWWAWRPRDRPAKPSGAMWKLYISPQPDALIEALRATFAVCLDHPVASLKYGGDASGLLRPDKLVVHLETRAAVHAAAATLEGLLAGCPVHGVPFSGELGGDGLISHGCDPPPGSPAAQLGGSWRAWVTRCLAEELTCATTATTEPWRVALDRIAAAGVDPASWAPADDIWMRTDDPIARSA